MKKVLAAGGVVINQDNELLMILRRLIWDLPKGHLEKRETLEQCALREVTEETGLKTLEITAFLGTSAHVYFDNQLKEEAIKETHWYEMKGDKNEPLQPLETESIEKAIWVKPGLIKRYTGYTYDNIQPVIRKSSVSRFC